MGVVQRKVRDTANQRVATARTLDVRCAGASLLEAIEKLIAGWNAAANDDHDAALAKMGRLARWANSDSYPGSRHFFAARGSNHLIMTFGVEAERVLQRGFNPNDHGWVAQIEELGLTSEFTRIQVRLAKWAVNDAGLIWNGDRYVQMLDGLVHGLAGRYVSEAVDEADHRFISRS
jgi:hypothetical protein